MRNLLEYPVTPAEIVECCRREADLAKQNALSFGDMSPLLLSMAADVVEAAAGMLEGIEERFRNGDLLAYTTPWDRATALVRAFQAVKPPEDDQ